MYMDPISTPSFCTPQKLQSSAWLIGHDEKHSNASTEKTAAVDGIFCVEGQWSTSKFSLAASRYWQCFMQKYHKVAKLQKNRGCFIFPKFNILIATLQRIAQLVAYLLGRGEVPDSNPGKKEIFFENIIICLNNSEWRKYKEMQ